MATAILTHVEATLELLDLALQEFFQTRGIEAVTLFDFLGSGGHIDGEHGAASE